MASFAKTVLRLWRTCVVAGLLIFGVSSARADQFADRQRSVDDALDRYEMSAAGYEGEPYEKDLKHFDSYPFEYYHDDFYKSPQGLKARKKFFPEPSERNVSGKLDIATGLRQGKFQWNIAGESSGQNPNIAQEQEYSQVRSLQLQANAEMILNNRLLVDGQIAFGSIFDGESRESEYLQDDRAFEFSRIEGKIDSDDSLDGSVGGGLRFKIEETSFCELMRYQFNTWEIVPLKDFWITYLGGYSWHKQNFVITDGFQRVDTFDLFGLGPFPGLQNRYESTWQGPWLGVELYKELERFWGSFRFEYHFADYSAEADLNLRTDVNHPKSFEHEADGRGMVYNIGLGYFLKENWSVDLNLTWQNWLAEDGKDRLFLTDGTTMETRLNKVEWRAFEVLAGSTLFFE